MAECLCFVPDILCSASSTNIESPSFLRARCRYSFHHIVMTERCCFVITITVAAFCTSIYCVTSFRASSFHNRSHITVSRCMRRAICITRPTPGTFISSITFFCTRRGRCRCFIAMPYRLSFIAYIAISAFCAGISRKSPACTRRLRYTRRKAMPGGFCKITRVTIAAS